MDAVNTSDTSHLNDKMAHYRLAAVDPWHITEDRYRPENNELAESIFSLGNEYMGDTR